MIAKKLTDLIGNTPFSGVLIVRKQLFIKLIASDLRILCAQILVAASMYPCSYLEPVCCSMSSSNCCFLTFIQISQEAGQVVWYSHLSQNFPVSCDPHSQRLWHNQQSRSRCFSRTVLLFLMIQRMLAI